MRKEQQTSPLEYIKMNKMTTRTQKFLYLQNMRAHYSNMLKVESTIVFDDEPKRPIRKQRNSHVLTKAEKNWEYERLLNNTIIFRQLRSIGVGKTSRNISHIEPLDIYKKREQDKALRSERRVSSSRPKPKQQLERENALLEERIRTICPAVGSKEQWKSHYRRYKAQCKKLSRSRDISQTKQSKQLIGQLNSMIERLRPDSAKRISTSKSGATKRGSFDIDRNRYQQHEDGCPMRSQKQSSQVQNLTVVQKDVFDNESNFAMPAAIDSEMQEQCIKQLKDNELYNDD